LAKHPPGSKIKAIETSESASAIMLSNSRQTKTGVFVVLGLTVAAFVTVFVVGGLGALRAQDAQQPTRVNLSVQDLLKVNIGETKSLAVRLRH
jgi:hypothetical protein